MSVLANPRFRTLWLGQIVSNIGDWFTYVTLIIRIHSLGYGALAVSGLLISQMTASLVLGQFAGVVVDRFDRRRLMIAVDLTRAALILCAIFAFNLPAIYVLVFLCGLGSALFQPALSASIPNIVSKDQLTAANSLVATTYNLGFVLGPALGGLVAGAWGVTAALIADSCTFLTSALCIFFTAIPQRLAAAGRLNLRSAWDDVVSGVRYVWSNVPVRIAVMSLLFIMALSGMINVVEVYFAKDVLGAGDQGFGYMISGWGLGMVLGSLSLGLLRTRAPLMTLFLLGIVVQGVGVGVVGLSVNLTMALVFLFIGGFGNGVQGVAGINLVQNETPDELRGRALATRRTLAYTGWVISMAAGGLLAAVLPLRLMYVLVGVGNLAIWAGAWHLLRSCRRASAGSEVTG